VEERPPHVRRDYRTGAGSRRIAALVGVLLGFGLLAAIAWAFAAFAGGGDTGAIAPEDPNAQGTGTAPPKPTLRIVFPEGFTRKEMAERIAAVNEIAEQKRKITPSLSPSAYRRITDRLGPGLPADFKGVKAPHMEGFLFPATYDFTEDTTSRELVQKQVAAFGEAWPKVDVKYARRKNLKPYDVLIIASMVEKEVQVPKERPLVAAVIYNRLRMGMRLEIDATIRYGLDIPPTEPIHQSELDSDNPYNTRKFAGLPPTPIGNPGLASLQAAAHPAEVNFLYFVRKPDCKSHFFTASFQEFLDYPRAGLRC
jgi:peptidoglycan lytic transglycosylase G